MRYRIEGIAQVSVYTWVEARSEKDALRKAAELPAGKWKERWAGAWDEVAVGFVHADSYKEQGDAG